MFVLGAVAASHVAARQAQPQVDPLVAHLQAFFAALGLGLHIADLIDVRANFSHWAPPPRSERGSNGDSYFKARVAGHGFHRDQALDFLDDAVRDVEAETRAFTDSLGREKWLENL